MAHTYDIDDALPLPHPRAPSSTRRAHLRSIPGFGPEKPAQPALSPRILTCTRTHNMPRWSEGERLHHVFEQVCLRHGERDAVVTDDAVLTYAELDRRANQLARYLRDQGIAAGHRVGLLFDKSAETYIALLAVLKLNAAYVPFDPGFPAERIGFILGDADVRAVVSMSMFAEKFSDLDVRCVFLDESRCAIEEQSANRLAPDEIAPPIDQACYIIYTSGTTGHPKGVLIEHPSICNFVRVAAELYGYVPGDRVYQGMTIAFDFSVEEVWVPLAAGATLVPGRPGGSLIGEELAEFLHARRVTCMACCPTLLSTIERDLPHLRILLVGGEACPQNLVARWHREGRVILNSYGPTEATVTATLTELKPDKPVTIGVPLPTYSIVILDPERDALVASGELGEIGIAGIGLAAGYLNRDELTQKKFIRDFVGIANNPSCRIYRTGDLGRINEDGEVDYRGRIDTQVKIRGYRIELNEIEAVLLDLPQVAQAAVTTFEPEPGQVELVAYYALKQDAQDLPEADIVKALRRKLPAYMVPAYLERLDAIPMTLSNKADHKKLPRPRGARVLLTNRMVAPRSDRERLLAQALAELLRLEQVSVEDHFFDDLGANSLLMARFCARIRQNAGMSNVSMRDIYTNPTIARLSAHLDHTVIEGFIPATPEPFHLPSRLSYYGCGALQLLFYGVYGLIGLWLFDAGLNWTYAAAADPLQLYLRSVGFAAASFFGLTALSVAGKWLIVGRFKAETFPVWSLRYFRFWAAKTLIRSAPVIAFAGTPIYNVYLRLLGARIGRNAVIQGRFAPICTDLIAVGDNTILRKESILLGYRLQSNFVHTGSVEIGRNAFVGEASVLDIDSAMGDGSQLGHGSSLQTGQRIPDGKRWHGSPAVETASDYCPLGHAGNPALRRAGYTALQLAGLIAVAIPLPIMALTLWEDYAARTAGNAYAAFEASVTGLLLISAGWFFGSLLATLGAIYAVPRLLRPFLVEGRVYPMFGLHYWMQSAIAQITNLRFFHILFGDSSFIVHYMRFLGWKLNRVEQTGSNFGTNQRHDNPFLCEIGSGTMVSDGISMINVQMSASAFRLCHTRIGERNYLGNNIHYPPDGRTGANCLLGTKVMIPIDGPVRENVGLLGAPAFEIPRIVERDRLNESLHEDVRRARLKRKNVHNAVTAALFLATRWFFFFATLAVWSAALVQYPQYGVLTFFAAGALTSAAAILYFTLIERATLGFRSLQPKIASIYDPYFWFHERHWKLSDSPLMQLFPGTPVKNLILRLAGAKVGRMVCDMNCSITERSLTEIGDYANLNEGSVLQAHSLEEGVFKSDAIRLGRGCTLGPAAFVHYGVVMGDHAAVDADSFVMKGETLEPHSGWRGNPARMVRGVVQAHAADARLLPTGIAAE